MRWFFYIVGVLSLIMAIFSVANIASDIQIILAAVFSVAFLMCFGFGSLIKLLEEKDE